MLKHALVTFRNRNPAAPVKHLNLMHPDIQRLMDPRNSGIQRTQRRSINLGRTALGKQGTGEILAVKPGETLKIAWIHICEILNNRRVMNYRAVSLTKGPRGDYRPMNTVPVVSRKVFKGFLTPGNTWAPKAILRFSTSIQQRP